MVWWPLRSCNGELADIVNQGIMCEADSRVKTSWKRGGVMEISQQNLSVNVSKKEIFWLTVILYTILNNILVTCPQKNLKIVKSLVHE